MAKTQYDLNRIRKIYPQKRKHPRLFQQSNEIQTFVVQFSNVQSASQTIGAFTAPVVVITGAVTNATADNANINLWVQSLERVNDLWIVSIAASSLYTGDVHIHVHEGT